MVINVAEDFAGNAYIVKGIFRANGYPTMNFNAIRQQLNVTKNLRKGQKWSSVSFHNSLATTEDLKKSSYRLTEVKDIDATTKQLVFKNCLFFKEKTVDKKKKCVKYKELLQELDLYKENLRIMLKDLLVRVFILEDLNKIEAEDKVEFIMDKLWVYLKSGKYAYRV